MCDGVHFRGCPRQFVLLPEAVDLPPRNCRARGGRLGSCVAESRLMLRLIIVGWFIVVLVVEFGQVVESLLFQTLPTLPRHRLHG